MASGKTSVIRTRVYPEFARMSYLVYGLIISIAVFFVGALLAFAGRFLLAGEPIPPVTVPVEFYWSTLFLLGGSHFLFRSYRAIRLERQSQFRIWLLLSVVLATVFCVLQTIGMSSLLDQHWQGAASEARTPIALLLMVFLHIAHFGAGFLGLVYVTVLGFRGRYDHEFHNGVRLAAIYWRFLDIIWMIVLLLIIWLSVPA